MREENKSRKAEEDGSSLAWRRETQNQRNCFTEGRNVARVGGSCSSEGLPGRWQFRRVFPVATKKKVFLARYTVRPTYLVFYTRDISVESPWSTNGSTTLRFYFFGAIYCLPSLRGTPSLLSPIMVMFHWGPLVGRCASLQIASGYWSTVHVWRGFRAPQFTMFDRAMASGVQNCISFCTCSSSPGDKWIKFRPLDI